MAQARLQVAVAVATVLVAVLAADGGLVWGGMRESGSGARGTFMPASRRTKPTFIIPAPVQQTVYCQG